MQLQTDERCRLTSPDLFKPNASYEAEKTPDGVIRLVEAAPTQPGKARLIRVKGKLLVDIGRPFDMDELNRELEDYL